MDKLKIWAKGLLAAAVAGGAQGVITAYAAMGIDPEHFNPQGGMHKLLALSGSAAAMSAILAVAAYLKQSPVPPSNGKS